jgi:hypothetical protein
MGEVAVSELNHKYVLLLFTLFAFKYAVLEPHMVAVPCGAAGAFEIASMDVLVLSVVS